MSEMSPFKIKSEEIFGLFVIIYALFVTILHALGAVSSIVLDRWYKILGYAAYGAATMPGGAIISVTAIIVTIWLIIDVYRYIKERYEDYNTQKGYSKNIESV